MPRLRTLLLLAALVLGPAAAVVSANPPAPPAPPPTPERLILPVTGNRFALPPGLRSEEAAFALTVAVARPLVLVAVDGVVVRGPDGKSLPSGTARVERSSGAAEEDVIDGGANLPLSLLVRRDRLAHAGDYRIEAVLVMAPADPATLAAGPPAVVEEGFAATVLRPWGVLTVSAPGRIEARIDPWDRDVVAEARVRIGDGGEGPGLDAAAAEVVERGAATALASGVAAPLALTVAPGSAPGDLRVTVGGVVGAGSYRVPLEVRAPGAAAVPFDLGLEVRHRPLWLVLALALGVGLGLALRGLGALERQGEERLSEFAAERARLEQRIAEAADPPLKERLTAALSHLGKRESWARWGRGGDPAKPIAAAEKEALAALKDLESRRLQVERTLGEMEAALLPSPSDPPEIEAALKVWERTLEDLRRRLERGDVASVDEGIPGARADAARALAEAGKRWLVVARDFLESLRQRIPQAARVQLIEAVRGPLETFAGRVAESSPDHLRETVVAGRTAATALSEQAFALALKPVLRELTESAVLLSEFVPEPAAAAMDAARRDLVRALEPGDLRNPFRPVEALSIYEARIEQALQGLAGEDWLGDVWKAVREAVSLREYGRAAEATETVVRHRVRERAEPRRRTRVLEVVRLAPRAPAPRARIVWDAPPEVGFPLKASVVWLGIPPAHFRVRWMVEGIKARFEQPDVPSTTIAFEAPGWVSLRAVVEVEGEAETAVAETRLRVLPPLPMVAAGRSQRRAALWSGAQLLLSAGLALGAGYLVFADGFAGTARDYGFAIAWGLALDLLIERLRQARGARLSAGG